MQEALNISTDTIDIHADNPAIAKALAEYTGRWNRLVSSTNWEKGRIIHEWREALIEAQAPAASCTDDAWSRQVGNVTPQHTGRLRRVYQRFFAVRETYPGLYWSHFQAALDWDDAEMWLEGAVQNDWSIAQMQGERSRTLGALVEDNVQAAAVEVDEDAADVPFDLPPSAAASPSNDRSIEAEYEGEAFSETDGGGEEVAFDTAGPYGDEPAPLRPFENLPDLPADLHDAFESFKLAIIHHRMSQWQEIGQTDVLATLDALRQLAMAPAEA